MKTVQMSIQGMSCMHCVMSLKKELSKIDGVTINTVEVGKANVAIDESKVTDQLLHHAVEEAGYAVVSIQ
jgi:copper chaperone